MRPNVEWKLCWENELQLADHVELSDFFERPMDGLAPSTRSHSKAAAVGPARGRNSAQSATTRMG